MPYKDPKRKKEYLRNYYLEHEGKNIKRRNFGHHLSKEELAKYKHEYYLKNRVEINIYKNKWQKNWRKNPINRKKEQIRQRDRRRRLDHCEICNSKKRLQFHHWNKEMTKGNTLCKNCHNIQHIKNVGGNKYGD